MAEPSERDRFNQFLDASFGANASLHCRAMLDELIAAARAEGEAKMRAQWAAAVNMPTPNHDAEIAVILKGMKRPAMRLLSKQIQSLVAGVASICEAEGWRKAIEACAQIAQRYRDQGYYDIEGPELDIRALAEQPEPASKEDTP